MLPLIKPSTNLNPKNTMVCSKEATGKNKKGTGSVTSSFKALVKHLFVT